MKSKLFATICFALVLVFVGFRAFCQDSVSAELPVSDFIVQIIAAVKSFGGLSWMMKISAICLVIVSSMKVSFLQPMWAKLGAFQKWVAPLLALIGGLLGQGSGLTFAAAFAYLGAGAAAPYLHDILDLVKKIPGLGPMWVSLIELIEKVPVIGAKA